MRKMLLEDRIRILEEREENLKNALLEFLDLDEDNIRTMINEEIDNVLINLTIKRRDEHE